MNEKFHKLRPTKNIIDWSTTGSETEWWHWDLASQGVLGGPIRPTPNSKQLTHAAPRNPKKGAVLSLLNPDEEDDMFGCGNWMEIYSWVWIRKKFREWPVKVAIALAAGAAIRLRASTEAIT
nr:hypothetical protein CFP56_27464 [Quercus suber]